MPGPENNGRSGVGRVAGFGHAIADAGAVMIVGGNITGKTHVMTTCITELVTMGDCSEARAVGTILLITDLVANTILCQFQMARSTEPAIMSCSQKRV